MPVIAVNLVTGFLGVGKTTLVRQLLEHRPAGERWAVLVNEFGEVGIDAALLDRQDVSIREVAGGCLCCVSAPAFTTGLNRLIREATPQRILIEPSGLGHPARILEQLASPPYDALLHLQSTIGVLDARHLGSTRHLEHPVFQDQVHLADVIVANKADCYTEADIDRLERWLAKPGNARPHIALVEHGRMNPAWLDLERAAPRRPAFPEAHQFLVDAGLETNPAPAGDWVVMEGAGDGFHRLGWTIDGDMAFDANRLLAWLDTLPCERVKGVFVTQAGGLSYNRASRETGVRQTSRPERTRLTLIDTLAPAREALDGQLRALCT